MCAGGFNCGGSWCTRVPTAQTGHKILQTSCLSQHLFARLHSFLPLRAAIKRLKFSKQHCSGLSNCNMSVVKYVQRLECKHKAACPVPFSVFWNFLDFSRPARQKTGTSMRTINTFKRGHAFLIKWFQKQGEPRGGGCFINP